MIWSGLGLDENRDQTGGQILLQNPLTPHDMICSNLMLSTFSGPLFSLVSKFFPLFVLSKCARHAHSTCAQDLQQYCEFVLVKLIVAVLVVLFHGVFDLLLPLDVLPEICLSPDHVSRGVRSCA